MGRDEFSLPRAHVNFRRCSEALNGFKRLGVSTILAASLNPTPLSFGAAPVVTLQQHTIASLQPPRQSSSYVFPSYAVLGSTPIKVSSGSRQWVIAAGAVPARQELAQPAAQPVGAHAGVAAVLPHDTVRAALHRRLPVPCRPTRRPREGCALPTVVWPSCDMHVDSTMKFPEHVPIHRPARLGRTESWCDPNYAKKWQEARANYCRCAGADGRGSDGSQVGGRRRGRGPPEVSQPQDQGMLPLLDCHDVNALNGVMLRMHRFFTSLLLMHAFPAVPGEGEVRQAPASVLAVLQRPG